MNHPYESLTPDNVISCVESIGLLGDLRILAVSYTHLTLPTILLV